MKRMTSEHAAAIATSRLFLHKALDRQPEPRFRQEIEKNIQLLAEVRSFILHGLYTPDLPWPGEEPQGEFKLKDKPQDNGTALQKGVKHYGSKNE